VAKRPRHSRWRRVPGTFRFGEQKAPDPNLEPQRLTLYLTGGLLDTADALAAQAGCETVQEYCTALIQRAIETEQVRAQVANLEAQRGVLGGLREIADDPEYLAEWSAQSRSQARDRPEPDPARSATPAEPASRLEPATSPTGSTPEPGPVRNSHETATETPAPMPAPDAAAVGLSPSAEAVLRHAVQAGESGSSFLACLRRGEPVPLAEVADLARALHALEVETRDASVIDRRVVYALYRLAFESQVLHTDAWPGAFDEWTVDTLRAVQEAVDRILSGQDIRYDPPGSRLEIPL
jgi:hypothetical protein